MFLALLNHLSTLAAGTYLCTDGMTLDVSVAMCAAGPILDVASVLIPGIVGLNSLHKLSDHQITGGGFVIEMTVRAGGAIFLIQMLRTLGGFG
jgi:hypothetical protein